MTMTFQNLNMPPPLKFTSSLEYIMKKILTSWLDAMEMSLIFPHPISKVSLT